MSWRKMFQAFGPSGLRRVGEHKLRRKAYGQKDCDWLMTDWLLDEIEGEGHTKTKLWVDRLWVGGQEEWDKATQKSAPQPWKHW